MASGMMRHAEADSRTEVQADPSDLTHQTGSQATLAASHVSLLYRLRSRSVTYFVARQLSISRCCSPSRLARAVFPFLGRSS
jgi:hypothetical protein